MTDIEQKFYNYLASLPHISKIKYRSQPVSYQDGFSGKILEYYPTFTIEHNDGNIEHIEVLPASSQMPLTQYLYAQNNLPGWRMINKEELETIGVKDYNVPTWW